LLKGGKGNNVLLPIDDFGVPGVDVVRGGPGDDEIDAFDGHKDIVNCGSGDDYVRYDRHLDDVAGNCERRDPQSIG
jgi:hypothetical protein